MRCRSVSLSALAAGVVLSSLSSGAALGASLIPGTYLLSNHPDGSARPPLYGARLDEIVNVTGGHDIFTLDFDHAQSLVQMTLNEALNEVHIFGQAWGGRDTGSAYANDAYLGVWLVDFTYSVGVGAVPGDDDIRVAPGGHVNFGTVTLPGGGVVNVTDEAMDGYSFRLGDENNDLGHRGYSGISGWGWMSYVEQSPAGGVSYRHSESTDWLFTASYQVPAPGSVALMGLGALVGLRRKR